MEGGGGDTGVRVRPIHLTTPPYNVRPNERERRIQMGLGGYDGSDGKGCLQQISSPELNIIFK